ncbi:M48 family metallopeptidase [Puniceibacterium sediminis]|uniref:Peptidase family M48 n=1 Tax=Puniceibacterium sediminis TaxID=1608407 RepID=A0A238Z9S5_9RHOB|nr:M48 family metallopeptidase [Puniceibacterium sediminis]SNR79484.1 Peptidase family M48 [Puniceibacterium sediminis]
MRRLIPFILISLTACGVSPTIQPFPQQQPDRTETPASAESRRRAVDTARTFVQVVQTVEPVAERECRRIAPRINCNFQIEVDSRPDQLPNAFQTTSPNGRPIVVFNTALIESVENADELAFVMGHETAHHIMGHLERVQMNAAVGAVIFSGIAAMSGANGESVRTAEEYGAAVGARTFSKDFELEADRLGTIITMRAGFNAVRGAAFFTRLPDPGNRFLGTHPPNRQRIEMVRSTAAALSPGI